MATTTPNFGWSVPTSTDYVKDGATAIETLGDAIDARIGDVTNYPNQIVNKVSGVSLPLPYAISSGSATTSGFGTVSITYPTSRFTQTPNFVMTLNSSPDNASLGGMYYSNSTTGVSVYIQQPTKTFSWIAIQMKSATAAG